MITGGTSGVGFATASILAENGVNVVIGKRLLVVSGTPLLY